MDKKFGTRVFDAIMILPTSANDGKRWHVRLEVNVDEAMRYLGGKARRNRSKRSRVDAAGMVVTVRDVEASMPPIHKGD